MAFALIIAQSELKQKYRVSGAGFSGPAKSDGQHRYESLSD